MRPDQFKRKHRDPRADDRLRRQIAVEAARRMFATIGPAEGTERLREATEAEFYTAKRKAAAVLGHRVRPGDLPSDSEVREQVLVLFRSGVGADFDDPEQEDPEAVRRPGEHLGRFSVYKMRLAPLEAVKQNPKFHPEGDALYHSLQVFELAVAAHPYDEEFLLAALLHDVGKAIDPQDHVGSALIALQGSLTERTSWLIAHHMDLLPRKERPVSPRLLRDLQTSEWFEDLKLLRELDNAGRAPGAVVRTLEEALEYLKRLDAEDYLEP